jgi:molybdopterin synthase catalytic subunit
MGSRVVVARISERAVLLDDSVKAVTTEDAGAVVTFSGVVRNHDGGRTVVLLEYEAHPTASTVLLSVAESVAAEFDGVRIAIEHRIGALEIGDLALGCAVSSAHRADAFAASARLIDEVKQQVPIWKRQHFSDGTIEWVGSL